MEPGWWEETLMSFQPERGISVQWYLPWITAAVTVWRPLLAQCCTATDLYLLGQLLVTPLTLNLMWIKYCFDLVGEESYKKLIFLNMSYFPRTHTNDD